MTLGDSRFFLREQTADLHRQLEHAPPIGKLVAPDIEQSEYQECMQLLKQAYLTIDSMILEAEPSSLKAGPNAYICRSQWLESFVGLPPNKPTLEINPQHAEYFGARYVIEGSSMGAKKILENLERTKLNGDFHFWRQQAHMGNNWQQYCELLNTELVSQESRMQALNGAVLIYNFLIRLFNKR